MLTNRKSLSFAYAATFSQHYSRLCIFLCSVVFCFSSLFSIAAAASPQKVAKVKRIEELKKCSQLDINYSSYHSIPAAEANRRLEEVTEKFGKCSKLNQQGPIVPQVINGVPTIATLFREVARITYQKNGSQFTCTGVFIDPYTVLTAAHCGCGQNYQVEIQTNVKTEEPEFSKVGVLSGPKLFPGFRCGVSLNYQIGLDIALLKTEFMGLLIPGRSLLFIGETHLPHNQTVTYPVLGSNHRVMSRFSNSWNLYLAGFGKTESGQLASRMTGLYIDIVSRFCQRGFLRGSVCAMYREFVLAGVSGVSQNERGDSCQGDSGGPVYRFLSDSKFDALVMTPPKKVLVGLVSRGLQGVPQPYEGSCGGGGVYTALGTKPVLNWLKSNRVNFTFEEYNSER